MRHHVRACAAIAGTVLAAVAATGCSGTSDSSGSSGTASPSAAGTAAAEVAHSASATVSTKSVPLGKILVNDKGLTLYLFQADKTTTSTCTGACAKAWPPLLVTGKPTASGGVQTKMLSTTKRSDGTTQVTYNGHPLYRFAGDTKSGNTNGQGLNNFGAKWYVLGTDGKQITTAPTSQNPGGGY